LIDGSLKIVTADIPNKWGIEVTQSELWDFFGYMILVVFTAVAVFMAILPQAFTH
jgi:hypothetical protein